MVLCFRTPSFIYKTRTHTKSTGTIYRTAASSEINRTLPNFHTKTGDLGEIPSNLRVFTVAELKAATGDFHESSQIGEGAFGKVYKGLVTSLENPSTKIPVAVKYGNNLEQGRKEWLTEIYILGEVKHPNLVKLVGYCEEKEGPGTKLFLVYEYMPNGSLRDHLSSRSDAPLSWTTRIKVAYDTACGLTYLHEGLKVAHDDASGSTYLHEDKNVQIILRDLKSSNILLDEQWNAKLSDFGVAREGPAQGLTHISTDFAGTREYAAPEYIAQGHLTSKSDVWCYGVVLYELMTGRLPRNRNRPQEEKEVQEWVIPYTDPEKLKTIIDPRLKGKYSSKAAQKLLSIANLCLSEDPKSRPEMSKVVKEVSKLVRVPPRATTHGSPQNPLDLNGERGSMDRDFAYVSRSHPLKLFKCCFR